MDGRDRRSNHIDIGGTATQIGRPLPLLLLLLLR